MASTAAPASGTGSHGVQVASKASAVKANLSYLLRGPASSLQPASLATRSTLRSLRYVFKFVFWRLVRYFKYAAVAAGCTALAGTMAGAALPWVAAIAVPSVPVAAAIGLTTAAIKFGWRHRGNHFRQGWKAGGEGRDARVDERRDAEEAERGFERPSVHPRAGKAWAAEGFA